jgi:peptidoglycan-associated lipoprotein
VQDFVINIGERIYFDTDSYDVRSDAQPTLAAQAQWLNRYPAVRVRIEGNADERGTREYNLALGARRANAVREFLVGQGVSGSRIETLSYGKERPIDGGHERGRLGQEPQRPHRHHRRRAIGSTAPFPRLGRGAFSNCHPGSLQRLSGIQASTPSRISRFPTVEASGMTTF